MNFKRSERVSELLRHEISMLVQDIQDPRLGFVTITAVHVSDDLTDAKVYYSVFGNQEQQDISSKILIHAIPHIRHQLGRKLESLRRVPEINFIFDRTPEQAQRVDSILKQIAEEKDNLSGKGGESDRSDKSGKF